MDNIVIVGSGVGGLACALSLAPRSVTLLTKTPELQGGASFLAQGGIAAAVGPDDSPKAHAADTIAAGAGLSNHERTRQITMEGAASLEWLIKEGIPFDRDLHGALALAKEGAHQHPRVAHAGGDATGQVLVRSLVERVCDATSVNVVNSAFAYDLLIREGRVCGVTVYTDKAGWKFIAASHVVLATGGIGMAWRDTTNPVEATGDGLAMAARAGARLANLEFVQFHPTALAAQSAAGASRPLLTEALRGAGALLLNDAGERFMLSEHPLAELAPRDVVARAIERLTLSGENAYLDMRPVLTSDDRHAFPQAVAAATAAGFDPRNGPLPVRPAAHYHMGGIEVDNVGRTSVAGLWACGEVTFTGLHGANRLASNSLLETLVYARKIAAQLNVEAPRPSETIAQPSNTSEFRGGNLSADCGVMLSDIRDVMSRHLGILRSGTGLETAYTRLSELAQRWQLSGDFWPEHGSSTFDQIRCLGETRNLLLVARLVTLAALRREESRGAHYRDDFPLPKPEWCRQQSLTVSALHETH